MAPGADAYFDLIREMKVTATTGCVDEFINAIGSTKHIHTPMVGAIGLNDRKIQDSAAAPTVGPKLSFI
jgi:hypothetical protein